MIPFFSMFKKIILAIRKMSLEKNTNTNSIWFASKNNSSRHEINASLRYSRFLADLGSWFFEAKHTLQNHVLTRILEDDFDNHGKDWNHKDCKILWLIQDIPNMILDLQVLKQKLYIPSTIYIDHILWHIHWGVYTVKW